MDEIYDGSFNLGIVDSGNVDNSENNFLDADIDVNDALNTDNSVNNSGNIGVVLENVGNVDTTEETTVWENVGNDNSDNSINGSFNDESDNSINDSGNVTTVTITEDNSVNAGNREYNTGFQGGFGGFGGGGGDVRINSQTTVVDQSSNGNFAGGAVDQTFANVALVASGDDSVVVGGDYTITNNLDQSTTISADGGSNINIDSVVSVENVINSGNSYTETNETVSNSTVVDINDSFNSESIVLSADGSFNVVTSEVSEENWTISDVDVIWNSDDSGILGDVDISF